MTSLPRGQRDSLMDHEYDGIREYDNPTPSWWHAIFLATILFSIGYFVFYEYSPLAPTIEDNWRKRQVAYYREVFGQIGDLKADEPTIVAMMKNEQMMAVAEGIFLGNCAACHARDGGAGGLTGVNLTDDSYKNVRTLTDIVATINKGAGKGAMPAWENRLSQNERVIVAAYVANLRGKPAPNGKLPEGERIPPWPTGAPHSSTPSSPGGAGAGGG
jgi:cytochrome c oxidase cbb3-type subunit 3